ncbi:MAG TPA: YebC/PmpR family DNA-binding transcriptional regulator [Vitreimonas sp.]|uniref:YebC/PmpR family DNA-binding transcriptional regulator n=1 Tax=Vitreimonas sp. TaxID=3069702 RepID=UPI002D72C42D|nr:YebC/PmpR family DNA-binding transcriptional regulator [Vitreimonas sp.]HYD87698.1 YebC/PmpR family DNA-binding transcriptional regulator [Vitreimonas sp.]
MAGHSKFANIMHRKGAQDKKRAQMFTKLAREIQAAVKLGGADPESNPRLYRAITAARAQSMPKDNIQRAVDRGAGAGGENLEEIRYEGFGPGGIGVIVECLSDNRNRTAGEVRAAFAKNGGNMGESNSVSFAWKKLGEVRYPLAAASEDAMLEAAIEAGADDCVVEEEQHVITCDMAALAGVSQALAKKFGDPVSAKFVWRTDIAIPVEGDNAETLLKLLDQLDDLDDVQDVYSNEDISEAELQRLSA